MLATIQTWPIWVIGTLLITFSLGLAMAGIALANRLEHVDHRRGYNDIVGFVIAVVGTIYAVLLAWVAIITWEAYDRAELLAVEEASSAGDLGRLAIGLPADPAQALRIAVRDYAEAVVVREWPMMAHGRRPTGSQEPLGRIEKVVAAFKPADGGERNIHAAMLERLADLLDARRERLHSVENGVQALVWWVILVGGMTLVGLSCMFGLDPMRHQLLTGFLALSIAINVLMIVAMDRPFVGTLHVSPEPFEQVLESVTARPP